jgi:hypothetical protein
LGPLEIRCEEQRGIQVRNWVNKEYLSCPETS